MIEINFSGNNVYANQIRKDKEFGVVFSALMEAAGHTQPANVNVSGRIKGTSHSKGLALGTVDMGRRAVELKWQPGGNDTRLSVYVSAPRGVEPIDFHKQLDALMVEHMPDSHLNGKAVNGHAVITLPVITEIPPALPPSRIPNIPDEVVDLFLETIRKQATKGGVVTRENCAATLRELDRHEPDKDIALLIQHEYLSPGSIGPLVNLGPKALIGDEPVLELEVVEEANMPVELPPAAPSVLIDNVQQNCEIAAKATMYRGSIPVIEAQIEKDTEIVNEASERIERAKARLQEAQDFLTDPAVMEAEATFERLCEIFANVRK